MSSNLPFQLSDHDTRIVNEIINNFEQLGFNIDDLHKLNVDDSGELSRVKNILIYNNQILWDILNDAHKLQDRRLMREIVSIISDENLMYYLANDERPTVFKQKSFDKWTEREKWFEYVDNYQRRETLITK